MIKAFKFLFIITIIICVYSCNSSSNSNQEGESDMLEIQPNHEVVTDIDGKKIYIEGIIEDATASHGIFSIVVKITKGVLIGKTIEIYLMTGDAESEEGGGGLRFDCSSFKLDAEMEACSELLEGIYGQIVNGLIFEKESKFDDYEGESPYKLSVVYRPFELHLKRK